MFRRNQLKVTTKRFSVLPRENLSDLLPTSLAIDVDEQWCTRKDTTLSRESAATPNNGKISDKPNKDLSKRNSDNSKKHSSKTNMKHKKFRQSRDVRVILGDSIIKDVKGWQLPYKSNKAVVKFFRGATNSQMRWHVKPTTKQNPNNI